MVNPKDENNNGEVKGDLNGEVKGNTEKEEFIPLGGGAYLENSSGNLVDKNDIVPEDNNEFGNGSDKGGK